MRYWNWVRNNFRAVIKDFKKGWKKNRWRNLDLVLIRKSIPQWKLLGRLGKDLWRRGIQLLRIFWKKNYKFIGKKIINMEVEFLLIIYNGFYSLFFLFFLSLFIIYLVILHWSNLMRKDIYCFNNKKIAKMEQK
jgi:hypothetical protein